MAKETNQDYIIDSVDREILGFLVANSRVPFAEIAKELIVSPGTIHARVRKMEEKGIIKKYSIGINYNDLGYRFTAYLGIFVDQTSDSEKIVEELKKIPEVTVAHLVTGQYSVFCNDFDKSMSKLPRKVTSSDKNIKLNCYFLSKKQYLPSNLLPSSSRLCFYQPLVYYR